MAIDSTLICTDWPRLVARIKRNASFLPELQPFGTKRPGLEMTGAVIVHSGHSFTGSYCLPALNFSDRIVPAIFVHQSVRKCNSKGPRMSHWGRIFSEVTFDNFSHSMALLEPFGQKGWQIHVKCLWELLLYVLKYLYSRNQK